MFHYATSFNQDIGDWDVSAVVYMQEMFYGASSFNQNISNWNIENVHYIDNFFLEVTLSTENYNAILTSWSQQNVQPNLNFHGGYSQYSCGLPEEARQSLIDNHGWTITDGGQTGGIVSFTTITTNILCVGESTGVIEVIASGGNESYQYSIDNGANFQSSPVFENLAANNYNVVVKDDNNCSHTAIVSLAEPEVELDFTTSITHILCQGESTGVIEFMATGGSPAYQYSIDFGENYQSSPVFENLTADDYPTIIKDANNCTKSETIQITEPLEALDISIIVTNADDYENPIGSIEIIASGGTPAYSYSIDNGATFQTSNLFEELIPGDYEEVVKDANVCDISETASIASCYVYDFDCDCDVDIVDVSTCTYHYGKVLGDELYDPIFDFDSDGDIDILDITKVAYAYTWTCDSDFKSQLNFNDPNSNVELGFKILEKQNDFEEMEIYIDDVSQLGGFELSLEYDPNSIEILTIEAGDFIENTNRKILNLKQEIDTKNGWLYYAQSSLGSEENGAQGGGILLKIQYKNNSENTSQWSFLDALLARVDGEEIDFKYITDDLQQNNINHSNYIITNQPNPFSEKTNISYHIGITGNTSLTISDMNGGVFEETKKEYLNPGEYNLVFKRNGLPKGVYLVSLVIGDKIVDTEKIIIQ